MAAYEQLESELHSYTKAQLQSGAAVLAPDQFRPDAAAATPSDADSKVASADIRAASRERTNGRNEVAKQTASPLVKAGTSTSDAVLHMPDDVGVARSVKLQLDVPADDGNAIRPGKSTVVTVPLALSSSARSESPRRHHPSALSPRAQGTHITSRSQQHSTISGSEPSSNQLANETRVDRHRNCKYPDQAPPVSPRARLGPGTFGTSM